MEFLIFDSSVVTFMVDWRNLYSLSVLFISHRLYVFLTLYICFKKNSVFLFEYTNCNCFLLEKKIPLCFVWCIWFFGLSSRSLTIDIVNRITTIIAGREKRLDKYFFVIFWALKPVFKLDLGWTFFCIVMYFS